MLGQDEKPRKNLKSAHTALAQTIKSMRMELKLTQRTFAEMTGIGLKTIRTLEQGGYNVNLEKVQQLMKFLGLELVPMPRGEAKKYLTKKNSPKSK